MKLKSLLLLILIPTSTSVAFYLITYAAMKGNPNDPSDVTGGAASLLTVLFALIVMAIVGVWLFISSRKSK